MRLEKKKIVGGENSTGTDPEVTETMQLVDKNSVIYYIGFHTFETERKVSVFNRDPDICKSPS